MPLHLRRAVQTPVPSKQPRSQLRATVLLHRLLSQNRTLKPPFLVNGPVKEAERRLFLEAVQDAT